MNDELISQLEQTKMASYGLPLMSTKTRNLVLRSLADRLLAASDLIISENSKDLALMDKNDPKYDRLLLSPERIQGIVNDINAVIDLRHNSKRIISKKSLPNGLELKKVSVPLGVVAVIYESRPNVTVDVFSLCFKSGNACVLKGGKEAQFSNTVLVSLIKQVLNQHQINSEIITLLPATRSVMNTLLTANKWVDVCIPRGGKELIQFVREHAKIPVIETGAGIVHTYFDVSGDREKGRSIIFNAKTRRVSVCNALDTLIIHQDRLADLVYLAHPLMAKKVTLFADANSFDALSGYYPEELLHKATIDHYGQEFLDYQLAIKTVSSPEEAVTHVMRYTSGHSEAIIAEDLTTCEYFVVHVDAAAVYINASTAFTDGGQFGMGAEIGISTQKLHARGPMSLDALTSYKWTILGNGQIRV